MTDIWRITRCLCGDDHDDLEEITDECGDYEERPPTPDDILSAALNLEGVETEWYCEAWDLRHGVSEPCEAGSTHDAPDFDCHWRAIIPLPPEADE